jgi:hypothetical protein
MMKKLFVLVLVLGLASGARAALTLVGAPADLNVGEKATITVNSSTGGSYAGWLQIEAPAVADYDGAPQFTPAGDPMGKSKMLDQPDYPGWYQFLVASLDPDNPIAPGDHIQVNVIGVSEGRTRLALFADDGFTELDHVTLNVIPEPATIGLLGLGAVLLRRRK